MLAVFAGNKPQHLTVPRHAPCNVPFVTSPCKQLKLPFVVLPFVMSREYVEWQWRNFLVLYLCQLLFHVHDVGQPLHEKCLVYELVITSYLLHELKSNCLQTNDCYKVLSISYTSHRMPRNCPTGRTSHRVHTRLLWRECVGIAYNGDVEIKNIWRPAQLANPQRGEK